MENEKRIITDRLVLRKLKREDAEAMFRNWTSDPEVPKYTLWAVHDSVEVTKQLVDMWLKEDKNPKTVRFIITLKEDDEPIGSIDVVEFHNDIPEIGYCLSRKHWNKGYMTEACQALINYLFELGYPKILIRANFKNIGSNKVIKKCGFKFTHQEYIEHLSKEKPESALVNWYELKK